MQKNLKNQQNAESKNIRNDTKQMFKDNMYDSEEYVSQHTAVLMSVWSREQNRIISNMPIKP
jgi:hypothetical protein